MNSWKIVVGLVIGMLCMGRIGFGVLHGITLRHQASCAHNLKQLGLAMRYYSSDQQNDYCPPISRVTGQQTFDMEAMYRKYVSDPALLQCPSADTLRSATGAALSSEALMDDHSYWYLGAGVWNAELGRHYIEKYQQGIDCGEALFPKERLTQGGTENGVMGYLESTHPDNLVRTQLVHQATCGFGLVHGAVRIRNEHIPVMIERPGHHKDGAHVLYMDGHVELIPYPGKFPMTEEFIGALEELDDLGEKWDE